MYSGFIRSIPKTELHLHIEGTLEPELAFKLANRNKIKLKYESVEELANAFKFTDLQSFLDIYYECAAVLRTEEDFFELAMCYFQRAKADGVVHAEIFFDPQTHTQNGVKFDTVMKGLIRAVDTAKTELNITAKLIPNFLRHLSEEDAFRTLEEALPFFPQIAAFGLDSGEIGNPPNKFARVFNKIHSLGKPICCHAGEEGPIEYVREAVCDSLVFRIDHGIRIAEHINSSDPEMIKLLDHIRKSIGLTVCPLSNVSLKSFEKIDDHTIGKLLRAGFLCTVNSDDPAYFQGYIAENFIQLLEKNVITKNEAIELCKNSFRISMLSDEEKQCYIKKIEEIAVEK